MTKSEYKQLILEKKPKTSEYDLDVLCDVAVTVKSGETVLNEYAKFDGSINEFLDYMAGLYNV